jgi:hypothetical protein
VPMRVFLIYFISLLFFQINIAQVQEEVNPPDNIKSIIFKGPTEDQFPVIKIGEPIYLEFDDILANEQDYYYKITHCDYDWKKSSLLKSQYLDGIDNQRITDYENSYSTLESYSNYQLTIPNDNVRLKVSGNYVIEIYNSYDELQFSRRFLVYKDMVTVASTVKRSRDFNFINEKQVVQFSITSGGLRLINPKKEVKVTILQNYHWPTAISDIPPQYTLGNELVYKYDQETAFYGGNEYLLFDTSDLRAPSSQISSIDLTDLYNHYLFADNFRNDEPYTYFPDINGDFVIRTLQGDNASRESEYTNVYFSLPYTEFIALDDVYIFGKYNNYALTDENKMTYNEENGMMEATLKMKQGFYNYKYVLKSGDQIKLNDVGGNFHFTENTYLILVYYRNFGDMYDSLIGIGSANSRNITN